MNKPLSGKTAIVTGSSSGIGYATASTLAQAGAAVVLHARRKDRLDKLASEIAAQGGKVLAVAGDASIQTDIDLLFDRALGWDEGECKVDIVVVNAGRGLAGGILDSDESQWQEIYQINVLGAAHLMRRAGQYMVQRKTEKWPNSSMWAIGTLVGVAVLVGGISRIMLAAKIRSDAGQLGRYVGGPA